VQTRLVPSLSELPAQSVIIAPYFEDDDLSDDAGIQLKRVGGEALAAALARGEARAELYDTFLLHGEPSILLVGLERRDDVDDIRYARAVAAGTRYLTRRGFHALAVLVRGASSTVSGMRAAVQGTVQGSYYPGLLKSGPKRDYHVESLTIVAPVEGTKAEAELERARVVAESSNMARDLVNLPPNEITPTTLAERAQGIAQQAGLSIHVYGAEEMRELGMGSLLSVAQGSAQPPRLIELRYGDDNAATRLTFVGKGLTFDSGGLSLKPAENMEWMKCDMAGAAAVIGAMRAVGLLKPSQIAVRGLIGAVENMPSGSAMKPGDVLRAMNGKTIEVLNTDAEGRLVLADVLAYAVKLGATHIVDLATLTGAAVVALGHEASALMGKPQEWVDGVMRSATRGLERVWQLPLYREYRRQIDSDIADMKNVGGRPAGALTAASLLAEFVDGVPWAHLDIAGTAWTEEDLRYAPKGATGFGVATLVQLAFDMAAGEDICATRLAPS
jgi:leucyl aminopeptidase